MNSDSVTEEAHFFALLILPLSVKYKVKNTLSLYLRRRSMGDGMDEFVTSVFAS